MTPGRTQPQTEDLSAAKARTAHKVDNLTAICESIVRKIWDPRHVTTLWDSTSCYKDRVTFFLLYWQDRIFV
jgi:hypothetical protein